jgi:hypothetical protein
MIVAWENKTETDRHETCGNKSHGGFQKLRVMTFGRHNLCESFIAFAMAVSN